MVEWTTDQAPVQNMYVVSVTIPPTIMATNPRVEKREGEDAELSCVAKGTPRPTVHWTRKVRKSGNIQVLDQFLQISEQQLDSPVGDDTSILHLTNLTRDHSGVYSCLATNGAGYPARDTMLLVVQCEFSHHICYFCCLY